MKKKLIFLFGLILSIFYTNIYGLTKNDAENILDDLSNVKAFMNHYEYNENNEDAYIIDLSLINIDNTQYNRIEVENYLKENECDWITNDEDEEIDVSCYDYYNDEGVLEDYLKLIEGRYKVKKYVESFVNEKNELLTDGYQLYFDFSADVSYPTEDNSFYISIKKDDEELVTRKYLFITKEIYDYALKLKNGLSLTKVNNEYHIDFTNIVKPEIKYRSENEISEEYEKYYEECLNDEEREDCEILSSEVLEKVIEIEHLNDLNDSYKGTLNAVHNKYPLLEDFFLVNDGYLSYAPVRYDGYYVEVLKVKIDFANVDESIKNEVDEIINSFEDIYTISHLHMINMNYHYGSLPFEGVNDLELNEILFRYSDIKKIIENNKDFNFRVMSNGGYGDEFETTIYATIAVYKDNILYATRIIKLKELKVIYVDKNEEGTLLEKTNEVLNNYFKGENPYRTIEALDCPIDYDDEGECPVEKEFIIIENDDYFDELVNNDLKSEGTYKYGGILLYGDDEEYDWVMACEVNSELIKNGIVESTDAENDVSIETDSYDVPLDATIISDDVSDEDYVLLAENDNEINIISAFDLKLFISGKHSYLSAFKFGLYVYFPIVGDFSEGDKVNVVHISHNGVITEVIEGSIVKVGNNLYVKFLTTHFSTFALTTDSVEIKNEDIEVPTINIKANNNKLTLSWDEQQTIKKANIYRSFDGKKYSKVDTVETNSYSDSGLTYGKTYYYKIKVYGNGKWSSFSNVVKKKVLPNKVTGLNVLSISSTSVKVGYDKVSVSGYEIHYSTDNKTFTKLGVLTSNKKLEYTAKSLKSNKKYYFKVRAYKTVDGSKVYGSFSSVVSAKTAPASAELSVKLTNYDSMQVTIGESKGASVYVLEKSIDGENYELVEELPKYGNIDQTEQEMGVTYYFRVKACNKDDNCSSWTKVSLKQTTMKPTFTLTTKSKKVIVNVSKVEGASGYQIYRSTKKGGKYTKVKEFTSVEELLKYVDKTKKGTTYYYKVRSFALNSEEKNVYSPFSSVKSITSK